MYKVLLTVVAFGFLSACVGSNKHYNPYRSHHTEDGFRNTQVAERLKKQGVMRWLEDLTIANKKVKSLAVLPDVVNVDRDKIFNPNPHDIQITWIGHATFLIQYQGRNILTDPVFSKRVSPLPFIGPKRHVQLPITIEELPEIDMVMLSHNHYDHLDYASVKKLGNDVLFMVPLGLKRWFRRIGITNVIEADWWQTVKITGFNFTMVPAQHLSGRIILDMNKTLWGGWVISKDGRNIYFAGDTGYSKEFKEVGRRFKSMEVSLLPIGAYAPRDQLKYLHADPFDSVRIHRDVNSQKSFGMHWGTFRLTTEPMGEPPTLLKKALKRYNIDDENEFTTLKIGETYISPKSH